MLKTAVKILISFDNFFKKEVINNQKKLINILLTNIWLLKKTDNW